MRLPWSHCRNIIITGQGLRTRVEVPLYDIVGELMNVRREGGNLIINFVKKPQKLTPPGLDTPVIKKDAVETRDPGSIRQADSISNGEEWAKSTDRYD